MPLSSQTLQQVDLLPSTFAFSYSGNVFPWLTVSAQHTLSSHLEPKHLADLARN